MFANRVEIAGLNVVRASDQIAPRCRGLSLRIDRIVLRARVPIVATDPNVRR